MHDNRSWILKTLIFRRKNKIVVEPRNAAYPIQFVRNNKISYVPFVPLGQQVPLFMVHIPKTAGTSVNQAFRKAYGTHNYIEHAEAYIPAIVRGDVAAYQVDYVSGHIPSVLWDTRGGSDLYRKITFLRDPWQRLVSHINWVESYNHRDEPPPGPVRALSEQLGDIDFNDPVEIQQLFDHVEKMDGVHPFDNYQLRMLRPGRYNIMREPLSPEDLTACLTYLRTFFFFGFNETLTRDLAVLSRLLPEPISLVEKRSNAARSRVLTPDNETAKEIMAPWFHFDTQLYQQAQQIYQERFASSLKES